MRKKLIYMTVAALALMACQQQKSKEETESHFETMKVQSRTLPCMKRIQLL